MSSESSYLSILSFTERTGMESKQVESHERESSRIESFCMESADMESAGATPMPFPILCEEARIGNSRNVYRIFRIVFTL